MGEALCTSFRVYGGYSYMMLEQRRSALSSAELTALDLLRYPHASGGIDHILTVLSDLGERAEPSKLAELSALFERSRTARYLRSSGCLP
jgi:hypothetical protein